MEKLNRAQKCSNLGPQNLGSRRGPPAAYLNLTGPHTTMGLSTPDMLQLTLAPHLASLTTMGISC